MKTRSLVFCLFLLSLTPLLLAGACAHGRNAVPIEKKEEPLRAVLGEGDVIEIRVFDEADLSGKHKIGSMGEVRLPLVGTIKLSGLTPEEAAAHISAAYRSNFLKLAEVSVFVESFNSRKVFVLGQVTTPGPYLFEENMTVIGAVARAGGTKTTAASNSTVITRDNGEGDQLRIKAKVADIGRGEGKDIPLQPGDIVFVPESIF